MTPSARSRLLLLSLLLLPPGIAGCGGGGGDSPGTTAAAAPAPTVANRLPSISGTPSGTVTAGVAYAFQPTATDADGDALSFGITNKPAWGSFDTRTGRLAGSPAAADVGTTRDIVISVSDGKASAALPAFAITVSAPTLGATTVVWDAPATNTDGSRLADLAGYRILYGTAPNALDRTVDVTDPVATSRRIDGLASGTWHFAVLAYNSAGIESAPSALASRSIP